MNKYAIALVCATLSIPALQADIPGVTQAKDLLSLIPNILILVDKAQTLQQLSQNLKNPARSQAEKIADAQKVLAFMIELNPIVDTLFKICADTATAFKNPNAAKITTVRTNVGSAFGSLKDISDILEVASMMSPAA